LKTELQELFPEEDTSIFYSESWRTAESPVGPSGKLYRFYKSCKNLFTECGTLEKSESSKRTRLQEGNNILRSTVYAKL